MLSSGGTYVCVCVWPFVCLCGTLWYQKSGWVFLVNVKEGAMEDVRGCVRYCSLLLPGHAYDRHRLSFSSAEGLGRKEEMAWRKGGREAGCKLQTEEVRHFFFFIFFSPLSLVIGVCMRFKGSSQPNQKSETADRTKKDRAKQREHFMIEKGQQYANRR